MMSDVERVREEMLRMALGVHRDQLADRYVAEFYPRLKRARAAKVAPRRPQRRPREVIQQDERALDAIIKFAPAKSNVEIGNHLGCDGGRVSECMRAALADGRTAFAEGLKHLREVVRPAYERGDKLPYLRWQKAKKT
jgi:hypothetical protein